MENRKEIKRKKVLRERFRGSERNLRREGRRLHDNSEESE